MRILHFQRNRGNLETINALLGCAIFIPKLGDENLFDVYSDEQASQVLDVLYYTVNWMRVSISAFVTQDEPMIRRKVPKFCPKSNRIWLTSVLFCILGVDTSFAANRSAEQSATVYSKRAIRIHSAGMPTQCKG